MKGVNDNRRINAMFNRDRLFALTMLTVLWATIIFVYFYVSKLVPDPSIQTALTTGCILLLLFNTASIFAMLKHYAADKVSIYKPDIHHLDRIRNSRSK